MKYMSVSEAAIKWQISPRSVRNYCARGKIEGAFLTGKTWNVPETAERPNRANNVKSSRTLLEVLVAEKRDKISEGIYHKIQIDLTYNSNHIEGSKLTQEQTRYIYETNTIAVENGCLRVNDIVETANHFRCIDTIIDSARKKLTENMIKDLHKQLKNGTNDSRQDWFVVGDYKKLPNEVGGKQTIDPKNVPDAMRELLAQYSSIAAPTLDDLLEFHYRFENIHPFSDGNGRVGRLLLFKECLRCNIVPFIIDDLKKLYYYRGLKEWKNERGYLRDTCLAAQDEFKQVLDYFKIEY